MKKLFKVFSLLFAVLSLSSCALPFQSSNYPAWSTKRVLESYTLVDGRVVGGWMGANIKDKVSAKWYDFTVNSVEFVSEWNGKKVESNENILVHANITIKNTSNKEVYLFDGDFALVWNLEKEEREYATSIEAYSDSMLVNEMAIGIDEEKTIDTVYEIKRSVKKPMAVFYYEQYKDDGQKGNKYYVYIK